MRVAIISDVYPPLRSSGAVQLRDLARELVAQGHEVMVIVASPHLDSPWLIDEAGGVVVTRLRTPKSKDMGHVRRAVGEFLMPFAMMLNYRRCPLAGRQFDALIWYSPTIFLGPFVRSLKRSSNCPSYLIIRDIFPQWAADMGLLSRGFVFQFLDLIARYQYRSADVIGVQSPGNLAFFNAFRDLYPDCRLEVLQNWLGEPPDQRCSVDVARTKLAGRRVFVYAGNMGVAQQMDKLLDLALLMRGRDDVGFLLVGRGSEVQRLMRHADEHRLDNVLFHDEITPEEIPGLYRQCHVGMVFLDSRHRTHNIPGKFLTYMQSGIPVLASINKGNDLKGLVETHRVGRVSVDAEGADLLALVDKMIADDLTDPDIARRCRALSDELFAVRVAAKQIVSAVSRP